MGWRLHCHQLYLNSTSANGKIVVNTFCLWKILSRMSMNTTLGLKLVNTVAFGRGAHAMERASMPGTKCWYTWEHILARDPTLVPMTLVGKAFHGLRTWKFTRDHTQERSPMLALWQVVINGTQIQVTDINIHGHIRRPNRIIAKW